MTHPRFGLYYPYINFRDETWVKFAALYWPKMTRIVPPDYPTRDTSAIQILNEGLDWVIDLPPDDNARADVAITFETLINNLGDRADEWLPGYLGCLDLDDAATTPEWGAGAGAGAGAGSEWGKRLDNRVAGILADELDPRLGKRLIESGYAVEPNPLLLGHTRGNWLVMHRDLVWIYKCLLSEAVAVRNRLTLTSDQIGAHAAASGLSATQLALGGVAGQTVEADLATGFGVAAVRTAVPKDLAAVPMVKIVEIRQRFAARFDAWRDYIDTVGAELAVELKDVESPAVLRRYLDEAARRYAEAPVAQLRDGLAGVGVESADAALNMKFEAPTALAAAGLATGNPIAIATGAAVGIAQLRRGVATKARIQLASPSAYLLTIRERLEPQSWVQRVLATMRAVAGLRG